VGAVKEEAFSDEEVARAIALHPRLARIGPGTIIGELEVCASYQGEEIRERFHVRITKSNPLSDRVPALYEIGGRTNAIAAKWSLKDLRDVHRDPQGNACVCVKQEEKEKFPPGANLPYFIQHLVRDYLYGLAFFERHGRWPWGERSHGALGILEFYADGTAPQTQQSIEEILPVLSAELNWRDYHRQLRRPRGDKTCLCGSQRRFRLCHPIAWQGLVRLGEEMDRLGMRRRGAFDRARARNTEGC
jgi:hypothetical protein